MVILLAFRSTLVVVCVVASAAAAAMAASPFTVFVCPRTADRVCAGSAGWPFGSVGRWIRVLSIIIIIIGMIMESIQLLCVIYW